MQVISITEEISPKMYYYLKHNNKKVKLISIVDGYIDIYENELLKLRHIKCLVPEINKTLLYPISPCCKRKVDRGLIKDYRDNCRCIGSVINCMDCRYIGDDMYYSITGEKDKIKKNSLFYSLFKEEVNL